jgi:hypothetical protein
MKFNQILFCVLLFSLCSIAIARSGNLDTTFGAGGVVFTDSSGKVDVLNDLDGAHGYSADSINGHTAGRENSHGRGQ